MKNLFDAWGKIKPLLRHRPIALFLDYDGTLAPIVARPTMAKMTPQHREVLAALCKQKNIKTAVISGRELGDVKKRVGIPGIIYAGNHGLQMEGVRIKGVHPGAMAFKQIAKELIRRLELAYAFFPEVLVEDKTFSVSVHYRQASEDKIDFLKMILLKEIGDFLSKSQLALTDGKKVWEMRPPIEWNKGKTALWLLGSVAKSRIKGAVPVYIGDDVTDEDAFKALEKHGITVRVTHSPSEPSKAKYWLRSPDEVFDFLREIVEIRKGGKA